MNVMGTFQNDAMLRQITESVQINQVQEGQLINTKDEWSYFQIPRAAVMQSWSWDEATNFTSYDYCTVETELSFNWSVMLLLSLFLVIVVIYLI